VVAMDRHWLLWKASVYHWNSVVFKDFKYVSHWLIWKVSVFYDKYFVAMKIHWFAIECHCLPCKVNGCHGKILVVIGSHWMLKGFFFQIFMIEMNSRWFIWESMVAMTVSVCYWKSLVVRNVYGCYWSQ
jgi:hypothetical protein